MIAYLVFCILLLVIGLAVLRWWDREWWRKRPGPKQPLPSPPAPSPHSVGGLPPTTPGGVPPSWFQSVSVKEIRDANNQVSQLDPNKVDWDALQQWSDKASKAPLTNKEMLEMLEELREALGGYAGNQEAFEEKHDTCPECGQKCNLPDDDYICGSCRSK